ncbi:MAG: hypothetical protein AB7E42_01695 [Anaerotignaceae bacterium]
MNDKDFKKMSAYKDSMADLESGKVRTQSVYERVVGTKKEEKNKKESKSAIWWMIMIFCLVYGFEIVYKAIIEQGGL